MPVKYSEKQIKKLIDGIYDGTITELALPEDLYFAIAEYLRKGLYEGFGVSVSQASGSQAELLTSLRENIYLFSGAKTFQTVKAMEALLTEDGKLLSSKEFYVVARQEYDLYNKTWAESEYNTAVGQADAAAKWNKIEQDAKELPMLRYSAVIDSQTSQICRPLDGLVAPVNDPIWKKVAPLNHYNCRCVLLQEADGTATRNRASIAKGVEGTMNDAFKMNPGISGEVFSKDHPYFEGVPKKLGRNNFGFSIPEKD